MQTAALKEIQIGDRQRRTIKQERIVSLANSIASKGLMHAVVCRCDDAQQLHLVAGRRRMLAMEYLFANDKLFTFNGNIIVPDTVPYVLITDLSYTATIEAEYEENMERVDLPWQDQVDVLNSLHELRQAQNPKQTVRDTAKEVERLEAKDEIVNTKNINNAERHIARARIIAEQLDDPDVQRAADIDAAYRIASQKLEAEFATVLAERQLRIKPSTKHILIHGDMYEQLPRLPSTQFSVIIADPPYGIGADNFGDMATLAHQYKDTAEVSEKIYNFIFKEGFRITTPQAHLYMFCDIDYFLVLRRMAIVFGWIPWRTPLIWHKLGGAGHAPNRELGFKRSYELILFANKGARPFNSIYKDVIETSRESNISYAAQKPVELYTTLLQRSCLPGDFVLDPCCGSGPMLPAAEAVNVKAVAVELDEKGYRLAQTRLAELN